MFLKPKLNTLFSLKNKKVQANLVKNLSEYFVVEENSSQQLAEEKTSSYGHLIHFVSDSAKTENHPTAPESLTILLSNKEEQLSMEQGRFLILDPGNIVDIINSINLFRRNTQLSFEDSICKQLDLTWKNLIYKHRKDFSHHVLKAEFAFLIERIDTPDEIIKAIAGDKLSLKVISFEQLSHKELDDFLFPLDRRGELFLICPKETLTEEERHCIFSVWFYSYKFFERELRISNIPKEKEVWQKSLELIDIPVAALGPAGALLALNPAFSNLNILPNKLQTLSTGQLEEINNQTYRIERDTQSDGNELFFFVPQKRIEGQTTINEDLGIVSSSVAHELNNPIAGILSALTVIALDELPEDQSKMIDEMQKGARRCKDLVQTFLGFSRKNPKRVALGSYADAYKQGLDLIRSRVAESNIFIQLEGKEHELNLNVNTSVFSIVFYLILGELITACSHSRLIFDNDEFEHFTIEGEVHFREKGVEILLTQSFGQEDNLKKNLMVEQLLGLEGHQVRFGDRKISITQFPEQKALFSMT